jgi:hypothetical protein
VTALIAQALGRVLYLGIAEEIVLRWGLVSLVAALAMAWFAIGNDEPQTKYVAPAAIIIVAAAVAVLRVPEAGIATFAYARLWLINFIPGVAFGTLFWRYSLEAAIIGHGGAQIPLLVLAIVA